MAVDVLPERLRSPRAWLVAAVVVCGASAWGAVAWASERQLDFSGHLGVVGIAITLGSLETAYLVWRGWAIDERAIAGVAAAGACGGSLMILAATFGGVTGEGFVAIASGVGMLGMACAVGLYGLYRGVGRSSTATVVAVLAVATLAYFSSVVWEAVP